MSIQFHKPRESFALLAELGTANLERVIAIDSQSDEFSQTIPSTAGQRHLSNELRAYFAELGYEVEQDGFSNLLVRIPASPDRVSSPSLALMVHMDTSKGTRAVPSLEVARSWNGERIEYSQNDSLNVTVSNYPDTRYYQGEDVLHGPGDAPIGLDDKLGMCELMTLGQILRENPDIPRGELFLIFRPDEEIGRMAAVEGLAEELERRGIKYGFTVDGLAPFEVNAENFNAAGATVRIAGRPLQIAGPLHRCVVAKINGVNTHGATAKAEGYLNATTVFVNAYRALANDPSITPVGFENVGDIDVHGRLTLWLAGKDAATLDRAQEAVQKALDDAVSPHSWRGAAVSLEVQEESGANNLNTATQCLFEHLNALLGSNSPTPILSEDSDGYQGYTNPYRVTAGENGLELRYRLRDFKPEGLEARKKHLEGLCRLRDTISIEFEHQYINMGPEMEAFPELTRWALEALTAIGQTPRLTPIRGGTGIDPFLARGIPVANLGTGYFAPESEKELTSKQNIARHALWLTHLVQVVAGQETPQG
jgi:tripeptide aminopeptidase